MNETTVKAVIGIASFVGGALIGWVIGKPKAQSQAQPKKD